MQSEIIEIIYVKPKIYLIKAPMTVIDMCVSV